jgi:hypothetical protein
MQMNDLLQMLMEVPPKLAAGWGVWFLVGLVLSIWGRREKAWVTAYSSTKHKSGVRAAAGSKPPSGVRAPVKQPKPVPVAASAGDAFGELERLLEPEAPSHRLPGEIAPAPATPESDPALAAPQGLP